MVIFLQRHLQYLEINTLTLQAHLKHSDNVLTTWTIGREVWVSG